MCFDPGESTELVHTDHAIDLMWGLLYLRGWRHDTQTTYLGLAEGWDDPWVTRPVGVNAFIVEAALRPISRDQDFDDARRIADMTAIAWCSELDSLRGGGPAPALITGAGPDGLAIGNFHPGTLYHAMARARPSIIERMRRLPESTRIPACAYVLMHLDGSTVRPWSVAGRQCVFATMSDEPGFSRVFVALEDCAAEAGPETAERLLQLMVATPSG